MREVAKWVSSQRKIVNGECEVCGKPFKGTTKRRFCSNTCAARNYRARHSTEIAKRAKERYQRKKMEKQG